MNANTFANTSYANATPGVLAQRARRFVQVGSAQEVRKAVQWLMQAGDWEQAQTLSDAGLLQHPDHEDTVGIAGLLALSRGDFPEARELLTLLLALQQHRAPAATYLLLARACHCQGDLEGALSALQCGLERHPRAQELSQELTSLLGSLN